MNETLEINGIKYEVVKGDNLEQTKEAGLQNIARMMVENKINRRLILRRPKGTKYYFANEFVTKYGMAYSKPFSF